ncbi:MAG: tryptophan--tRNA ligase [Rickettsiales bacterium]|jgi:tryptophanyl-tRNA synthetase|nr:tryptophan--tRNA ligase [Rickettsiales bacterium]
MTNQKEIILTGIKPTGQPHLGNYIGAIKPIIEMSKTQKCFVFIADLHALNAVRDPLAIRRHTTDIAAAFISLGLNLDNCVFFRQSDLPQVQRLSSLLMNITPKGLMNRAHAYKALVDKNIAGGADPDAGVNMGLYTYPILMAADILLYNSTLVPVGQDQKQHIEFARDIAGSFNSIYGDILTLPEPYITAEAAVIPGLDGRKMSKSYGNTIPLFAPQAELKKKIMQIITDSKLPSEPKDPDSSTIFQLYSHFAGPASIAAFRKKFTDGGMGYGDAKNILLEAVDSFLAKPRAEYDRLAANPGELEDILSAGAARAREAAQKTLAGVETAMLGRSIKQ